MALFANTTQRWRQDNAKFWSSLHQFYQSQSINAWNNRVPFHITNNPDFGQKNAKLVLNYILDCVHKGYEGEFVIMECGSGLGKFAFYFLKEMVTLLHVTKIDPVRLKYILCDQSEDTISFWQRQPQLQPYFKRGILHTASLHLDSSLAVHCSYDTTKLRDKRVILLSNYCFDSLYQSPFQLEANQFKPCRIIQKSSLITQDCPKLHFKPDLSSEQPYSSCPIYDDILNEHLQLGVERTLMPDGPMSMIKWLDQQTEHPLLLVASDKGFTSFAHDSYADNYNIIYTGAYATCVNFYALGRYVELALQGSSILGPKDHVQFGTHLFLTKDDCQNYTSCCLEAYDSLATVGSQSRSSLYKLLVRSEQFSDIEELLGIFAELYWDPKILSSLYDPLEEIMQKIEPEGIDIDRVLRKFLNNYYFTPHEESMNELVCIGQFALMAKRYDFAKELIELFSEYHGKDYHYNRLLGTYHFLLSEFSSAAYYFTETLSHNPDCGNSREFLKHCETLL